MDKNTLVGFALIGAVIVGFSIFNKPSQAELEKRKLMNDSIELAQAQKNAQKSIDSTNAITQNTKIDTASLFYDASKGEEQFYTLKNDLVKLTFTNKGGRVCSATVMDYNDQKGKPLQIFDQKDSEMDFAFDGKQENILTKDLFFTPLNASDSTLTMRLNTSEGAYIDFIYQLLPNSYMVNFTVKAEGMSNFFPSSTKSFNINWDQKARQLEKGYSFEQRYTSLTYKEQNKSTDYLSESKRDDKTFKNPVDWIAYKNQFFSCVLIADQDFNNVSLTSTPQNEGTGYLKDYTADMTTFFDPTGQKPTNMQMYFGPNHFKTLLASNKLSLSDKDLELEKLVYLGWPIIRWINRWFTINLFDWLSSWGLSMGLVILLMTLIVKALVFPATRKSYISSAKMRVLKPYIQKINEKYPKKEDALKKQQETMALYSQYGVSPMGGCLPMLIQMPVFMALFFFVPNAIELRQQPLLWAPDMSTYDDIIHWGTNIPLLGDHLSLFCILFAAANIVNTMYSMKQQDPMQQQQMPAMKWMMYLMPVMFIFILNGYSSGLNYYYFISAVISIVTMIVLRRVTDEKKLLAKLEANKVKIAQNKKPGSGGLMEKLQALQKEQERIQQEKQNKNKK